MGERSFNFYGGKPATLPRFVYRRLAQALQSSPANRAQIIQGAIAELLNGKDPDFRKFKFFLPDYLLRQLSASEADEFRRAIQSRQDRARQLKMVYPHVTDEFSLDRHFLHSVFDLDGGPVIPRSGQFFTMGSCFARNIAEYLSGTGYKAKAFNFAEDLNSPISNAFIFSLVDKPREQRLDIVRHWVRRIFPEMSETEAVNASIQIYQPLDSLFGQMKDASCVVFTLGNVVDFFSHGAAVEKPLMEKIVPKFVALPGSEDIEVRSGATNRLRKQGAKLRLASCAETGEAIRICLRGIRALTPAPVVVTLSPVPIDSVIGLADSSGKSAIEIDCISKSRLRSAFDEVMGELLPTEPSLFYFPSFEIVRWVAPMMPFPTFGLDDAASRHVSSPILQAVCSLFVDDYVKFKESAEAEITAASQPA